MQSKLASLSEAVSLIADGAQVAIGGHTLRRHPMALIAEMIRQNKKNLHVMGWNNGIDMDMLIGAGAVATAETSYIGISNYGLALNYRRWAEGGRLKVLEHSEITGLDMFRAGAAGLSFMPNKTPLGTGLMEHNAHIKTVTCPFTGEPYAAIKAAQPDVAILHAHTADKWGNVQLDAKRWNDNSADVYIGWAAKTVIVTVEQIVGDEYVLQNPTLNLLPRDFVTAVVEAPYGAYPCCCDARYTYDLDHVGIYYEASRSEAGFQAYLDEWVRGCKDHQALLDKVGIRRLLELTTGRGLL